MKPTTMRGPARSRGFTLIEALVALVVLSFGMLALAGFQASLGVASENAKYRAQAVRLAQQKMEQLRAFEQIDSSVSKFDYAADVVSGGPETIDSGAFGYVTAAPYTRQWWVTRADGVTAGTSADSQKWIRVRVQWTDRVGALQSVSVQSVIARADPASLGTLAVGPGARQPRTPKNRNVDIPYPAISLPGGKSAFTPPGSGNTYIFDNVSGDVLGYCTNATNVSSGVSLDPSGTVTTGCTVSRGYLLSGYIRFLAGGLPSGNEKQIDDGLTNPTDATKETGVALRFPSFAGSMAASSPTFSQVGSAVTSTSVTTGSSFSPVPAASCFTQRQKVVSTNNTASADINTLTRAVMGSNGVVTVTTAGNHQLDTGQFVSINDTTNTSFQGVYTITWLSNNSFSYVQPGVTTTASESGSPGFATRIQQITMAEADTAPTGYNSVVSRFVAYVCIVTPSDDDNDESAFPAPAAPTPRRWWGQLVLQPMLTSGDSVVWTMGATNSDRKVCRFTGDYVIDDKMSNSEHPLHYRAVSGALDNQNFLLIDGNQTCPSDSKIDPLNSDYINTHTLLHQTAPASAASGVLSNTNTQWATTPEPAAPTSAASGVLPMF